MMKERFLRPAAALFLCLLLLPAPSVSRAGAGTVFFVRAHSNLYRDPFPVRLYETDGALYIDAVTLSGISGFARVGEKDFSLGGLTCSPLSASRICGTWCYPLERTLDRFCVRVWEKDGELYFFSGRDALTLLFEAESEAWRYRSLLDPDDAANTLGAALSYVKDVLMTWDLRPVMTRYRSAMIALVREDVDERTFSSLEKQWEDGVNKPVSTAFSFLGSFMDEEKIADLCAGSSLTELKDYMEGIGIVENVLGMKLSEYLGRLEEIALYFDTSLYALRAAAYLSQAEPIGSAEGEIVKAAKEITRSAEMNVSGWDERLIGQLAREHVEALFHTAASNLMKEVMLGKKSLASFAARLITDRLPVFKTMTALEEAYTFAEIQKFAEREMYIAGSDRDWVRYKYLEIMYLRCFDASCRALRGADMGGAVPDWEGQIDAHRKACAERTAALAGIPDSALTPFLQDNAPIPPSSLGHAEGPEADFALLAPRGEENGAPEVSGAERGAAVDVWNEACARLGRAQLSVYGGDTYVDAGDGAVLPLLSWAGEDRYLTVLAQQGGTLVQIVYLIGGDGTWQELLSDPVLTLGRREALFLCAFSGSDLITEASLDGGDVSVIAAAPPHTAEKRTYRGDEDADSIAGMSAGPYETVRGLYGEAEWTVRADAGGGLFRLEIRDGDGIRDVFGPVIP